MRTMPGPQGGSSHAPADSCSHGGTDVPSRHSARWAGQSRGGGRVVSVWESVGPSQAGRLHRGVCK